MLEPQELSNTVAIDRACKEKAPFVLCSYSKHFQAYKFG